MSAVETKANASATYQPKGNYLTSIPIGGASIGGVKNGGNVTIESDGTMNSSAIGGISNFTSNTFNSLPDVISTINSNAGKVVTLEAYDDDVSLSFGGRGYQTSLYGTATFIATSDSRPSYTDCFGFFANMPKEYDVKTANIRSISRITIQTSQPYGAVFYPINGSGLAISPSADNSYIKLTIWN